LLGAWLQSTITENVKRSQICESPSPADPFPSTHGKDHESAEPDAAPPVQAFPSINSHHFPIFSA
jgi:hypothetical protein